MLPPEYAELTENDKVAFWAGKMHREMRWAGESNHDEVEVLDRAILDQSRAVDPAFDRLMPKILAVVAWAWADDKEQFLRQVNQQMGTAFEYDLDYLHPGGKPAANPLMKLWSRLVGAIWGKT